MPQSVLARPARLSVRPTERSAEAPQKIPAQRSDAKAMIVSTACQVASEAQKAQDDLLAIGVPSVLHAASPRDFLNDLSKPG